MKTINILGDSQREQWHSVVNMLRQLGGDMTREGRSALCDELDRYIDAMEDANEDSEQDRIFVLTTSEYLSVNCSLDVEVKLFNSIDLARAEMKKQYEEQIALWDIKPDELNEFVSYSIDDNHARVDCYTDFATWKIEEKVVE